MIESLTHTQSRVCVLILESLPIKWTEQNNLVTSCRCLFVILSRSGLIRIEISPPKEFSTTTTTTTECCPLDDHNNSQSDKPIDESKAEEVIEVSVISKDNNNNSINSSAEIPPSSSFTNCSWIRMARCSHKTEFDSKFPAHSIEIPFDSVIGECLLHIEGSCCCASHLWLYLL